jgi:predicted metalloprotease with PDZ domain
MRLAYERYAGSTGYTRHQFYEAASDVAGVDLSAFFADAVESTKELDYGPALEWWGLRFKPLEASKTGPKAWMGAVTKADGGQLTITNVPRGTPAERAGLSVDDEIIAIDGFRVKADRWSQRTEQYRPGDRSKLLIARRDRLLEIPLTWDADAGRIWQLEQRPDATRGQKKHLQSWLNPHAD